MNTYIYLEITSIKVNKFIGMKKLPVTPIFTDIILSELSLK